VAVIPQIDRRSVEAGAGVGFVVSVLTVLAWVLVDAVGDIGDDSNLVFLFFAVMFAGWVAGAAVAGLRRPDAPYTHGLLAALAAYALAAVLAVVFVVARGKDLDVGPLLALAPFALLAGIIGGFIALWRAP
jgi:peptidoglycan/LPS O-acetylase OafA/YrhL